VTWISAIIGALTPEEWQAVGTMGTLVVAIVAAVIAFAQVAQAARIRREQARPYVAAYLEADGLVVTLIVKNFGSTVARDVRMTPDRPMVRGIETNGQPEPLETFDHLPVMVPGQEWRTMFDIGIHRWGKGLDEPYEVTIAYRDSQGRTLRPDRFVLDWTIFHSNIFNEEKDLDDVAKALGRIGKVLDGWDESGGAHGASGLGVVVRDGFKKDALQRRYADDLHAGVSHGQARDDLRRRKRQEWGLPADRPEPPAQPPAEADS
jgi:hypothetical protein